MSTKDIGRVCPAFLGDYEEGKEYEAYSFVRYDAGCWVAKENTSEAPETSDKWMKVAVDAAARIATTDLAGIVMPDGKTITLDTSNGAIAVGNVTTDQVTNSSGTTVTSLLSSISSQISTANSNISANKTAAATAQTTANNAKTTVSGDVSATLTSVQASTTDLTAGTSSLTTGQLYLFYT